MRPQNVTFLSWIMIAGGILYAIGYALFASAAAEPVPTSSIVLVAIGAIVAVVSGAAVLQGRLWGRGLFLAATPLLIALDAVLHGVGQGDFVLLIVFLVFYWFLTDEAIARYCKGDVQNVDPLSGLVPVTALIVTLPRTILGALILVGIVINFANVIGRYIFLAPIIWAEEIMIYIMVWTVFVGAVLVTWEGRHLKMDFFSIMLPTPWKEIINGIAAVSFAVICLFVLPKSATVTELMVNLDQRSVVAEVPMAIPHAALLIGFVLMFVAVVFRFRSHTLGTLESEVDEIVHSSAEDQDGKGQT